MVGIDYEKIREWYEQYIAENGNKFGKDSALIHAADSDTLDTDLVEKLVQSSTKSQTVNNRFCADCQHLLDDWPTLGGSSSRQHDSKPEPGGWEHAVARPCTTFELEGATRLGCRLCAFLLQSLKDCGMLDTYRKIELRLHHLDENATASLSVQNWGANPNQLLWVNLPGKFSDHCNSGMASEVKVNSTFLPLSADCYEEPKNVLDIAGRWLKTCVESHEQCKSDEEGSLPSRLIEITGQPRLVLTKNLAERPQYATLSHSWGTHESIVLNSENLESFTHTLPVDKLPQTFKDFIEITRKLGLAYVWIDSICIIQNSEEDWQQESALMRSVYGGSTITIAASSARDSSQGCFLKPAHFSGGFRARVTDGGNRRVQDFRNSSEYDLSTSDTHLGTRAWALQERMLPPRTIHFGERGAFWECKTTIASDSLPDGFPRQLVSPLVRRKPRSKFEWIWPMVVRLYSAANLTFGKDKLPALSGIARLGFNETGDQYLAGLWRSQMEEQLCWRIGDYANPTRPQKRPAWRAPSWSWASIDGEVGWRMLQKGTLETSYAQVLDASTTPHGPDPFGQITSGIIRLACSGMVSGYLAFSEQSEKTVAQETLVVVVESGDGKQRFPLLIDCLHNVSPEESEPIYLLPIYGGATGSKSKKTEGPYLDELMIQGMVLQSTGATKGEFARLGAFNFYKDKIGFHRIEDKELYEPFLRLLEEQGKETAGAVCLNVVQSSEKLDERFVITIV